MPAGAVAAKQSRMTAGTPVHSITTSGRGAPGSPRRCDRWRRARDGARASGQPCCDRSTCTSSPRCTPISAASRPIGPAPVTSTGRLPRRAPRRCARCAPRPWRRRSRARAGRRACRARRSTLTANSGSMRKRSAPIAVALLDAALRVAAVAAHVPFADRAVRARHGIGPPHDADDQVAARKPLSAGASTTRPSDS